MNKYNIFVDLSADMTIDFAMENDICFIPMEYSLGADFRTANYLESDEDLIAFYNSQRNGDLTKTTQITPFFYEEFFKEYLDKEINILYLTLSSGLSKTYESALLAKNNLLEEYPNAKIEIVDSLAATGGIGILTEKAVEFRNEGLIIEEASLKLCELTKRIRHWFLVSDLNYLKRGGRVSATTAFIGTALKITPILEINKEGKLDTIAKKRGVKMAANQLVEYYKQYHDENENSVYICHGDNPEIALYVKEKLLEYNPNLDIKISYLSPIIGAHTGPGMVSICTLGK